MSIPKRRRNDDDGSQEDPAGTGEPATLDSVESYPRKRISVAVSPASPGPENECGSVSAG